jgi:TatD DNase family protein
MLIDTHAHLNFKYFKEDADAVIQNSLSENIWMINVGADYKTSKRALDYANKYERGVYAAVGLHPMHLQAMRAVSDDYDFVTREESFNYDIYEKLAKFEKAIAIGEIGLDYYHIESDLDANATKRIQKDTFMEQLLLARRLDMPAIIHCRKAHDDLIQCIKDFKKEHKDLFFNSQPWAVIHCFSGDEDLAWQYFNLGLIISFTGLITFSRQWDDLIRKLPDDKYMIETDCPFMTPEPFRGKRNEPLYVKYVAEKIAEIKKSSLERISEVSTANARKLFKI